AVLLTCRLTVPEIRRFELFPKMRQNPVAELIRELVKTKLTLKIEYQDTHKTPTSRKVEPLGLVYWGGVWTMIAFCLLRNDYREFRLDRITAFTRTTRQFELQPTKNLQHYLSQNKTLA
ncbi:MAG: WYL domain-containing protein, partial [Alteromonadaceae bacterium]|nr:WYL domain-containing protein [Alteromonadaceae bacterium]